MRVPVGTREVVLGSGLEFRGYVANVEIQMGGQVSPLPWVSLEEIRRREKNEVDRVVGYPVCWAWERWMGSVKLWPATGPRVEEVFVEWYEGPVVRV